MKILVTGAKGFIGKNLIAELKNIKNGRTKLYPFLSNITIYECDIDTTQEQLDSYCSETDFIFHLAGVNRPQNSSEFMTGNYGFTTHLLSLLQKYDNKAPILLSSSIQASLSNEYGKSKKAGEDYLRQYGKQYGNTTYIYRLPNVFGKWCRPNYNSAVSTFCNNIANDLPISVNDRNYELTLVYIDDVVNAFINTINDKVLLNEDFCTVSVTYKVTLGHIVDALYSFKNSRVDLSIPNMSDEFTKKLYSTYLSYLPQDKFSYLLKSHEDNRGSFTEFIHTLNNGQVSVNISKPNVVKGQHWHHTKNEKFLVVSGNGIIRFRKIDESEIIEYYVSGEKLEVVDIPCGYTHNIENLGTADMVTIMWCNEIYDANYPDTYFEEV